MPAPVFGRDRDPGVVAELNDDPDDLCRDCGHVYEAHAEMDGLQCSVMGCDCLEWEDR